jgi:hypothetical protein
MPAADDGSSALSATLHAAGTSAPSWSDIPIVIDIAKNVCTNVNTNKKTKPTIDEPSNSQRLEFSSQF